MHQKWPLVQLEHEPSAIAMTQNQTTNILAVVASTDSSLLFLSIQTDGTIQNVGSAVIPALEDVQAVCDHILILETCDGSGILVVCGLRDGRIYCTSVGFDGDKTLAIRDEHTIPFGNTTVMLTLLPGNIDMACAMCGPDTCALSWDGTSAASVSVESIFVADKYQPEFSQGAIYACAQMPSVMDSVSTDTSRPSIVMISTDRILITDLVASPTVVPATNTGGWHAKPTSLCRTAAMQSYRLRCVQRPRPTQGAKSFP